MKKWLLLGIAAMIVALIVFLGQSAVDPEDFTGEWYSVSGQQIYLFQNGIIHCGQHSADLGDGSTISGAYIFSGKSVALFAMGVDGLETVKEIYLVENKEESLLCENADGTGTIYFVRHN
jgi:hypothetical protein